MQRACDILAKLTPQCTSKFCQLHNGRGLIAGQAHCLRHKVNPFRDARRPGSRNSVVFDGSFVISRRFQQMGTNRIETIVTGKARVGIERSQPVGGLRPGRAP